MTRSVLAIFARYPEPGKVKTRLARSLGDEAACRFYRELLTRQLGEHRERSYDLVVLVTPADKVGEFARDFGVQTVAQCGHDLGERMSHCFRRLLREYESVAIVGSDIPTLTHERVEEAFQATKGDDVVLGPCPDGGYYLIASRRIPDAFAGIPWSTPEVLRETLSRLRSSGLSWKLLAEERDIDEVEDLPPGLRDDLMAGSRIRVSVIVPVTGYDEPGARIYGAFDECIVVDGGTFDGVASRARQRGALVLSSAKGRAVQMNAGARASKGDVLLFLHADTRLPGDAARRIRQAVASGAVGGCFRTRFDRPDLWLRIGDVWRDLRARWLREFYGDQSIFVRRAVFSALGGYRDLEHMEDFDLCRRMRRAGRLAYLPSVAVTSARRYSDRGILHRWLRDQQIKAKYFLTTERHPSPR